MRTNGQQWTRVSGTDLDAGKAERAAKNKGTLESRKFIHDCEKVGIEPSLRQASKYRRGHGVAYHGIPFVVVAKRGW